MTRKNKAKKKKQVKKPRLVHGIRNKNSKRSICMITVAKRPKTYFSTLAKFINCPTCKERIDASPRLLATARTAHKTSGVVMPSDTDDSLRWGGKGKPPMEDVTNITPKGSQRRYD